MLVIVLGGVAAYGLMRPPVTVTTTGQTATMTQAQFQTLEELAKQEGKLVVYGAMDTGDYESVLKPEFQAMYPWADVTYLGMSGSEMATRMISEYKAGQVTTDVMMNDPAPAMVVVQAGAAQKMNNPMITYMKYPAGTYDPDGYWQPGYGRPTVLLYNTKLVKADQAPQSIQDLTDPKWQGKFVIDNPSDLGGPSGLFTEIYHQEGEQSWTTLMNALAANKPVLVGSSSDAYSLISSGQVSVGLGELNDYLAGQAKGYPVGIVWIKPYVYGGSVLVVAKNAPHPHMAELYMLWYDSADGQNAIATTGRFPANPMVVTYALPGALPAGVNPVLACGDFPDFYLHPDVWSQKYKDIFG